MKKDMKKDTEKDTKKYMTWIDIFIILGLIVCFSIAVPFLINVFYDMGCPLIDAWDKSDLMGYYGSIMTAAAAIAGVYFTLDYSKFKQMEYEKLRVKPYLEIMASVKHTTNDNIFMVGQGETYSYIDMNEIHTETAYGILPNTLNNIKIENKKEEIDRLLYNSFFLVLSLKNIGADSAISIKILFNDILLNGYINLSKNETDTLKILIRFNKELDMQDVVVIKDMNIRIIYENIYGNQLYEQFEYIKNFRYIKKTCGFSYNVDQNIFFSNQIEINN